MLTLFSMPPRSSSSASSGETSDDPIVGETNGMEGGTGEGVDRRIETNWLTPTRVVLVGVLVLAAVGVGSLIWRTATGGQTLSVDREKLTVATVERGPFQEFIAVTANALPEQTVYLDAVEGGRVEELFVKEGALVETGEPILRLSNNDLRRQVLDSEASIAEQRSRMEQLRLQMKQNRLSLQQQIAEAEYRIKQLEREHARRKRLHEQNLIAEERYLSTQDELTYRRRRLELVRSAYTQDSLAQASRLASLEQTERRLERNYEVLRESVDNLTVEAPIDGQLTALNPEVGQIIRSGARVGQVDKVDSYKLRAQIDEFYIERVHRGQTATTQAIGDTVRPLTVERVYPEVENGRFEVDLTFDGPVPDDVRRGQSVRLKLTLGQSEPATLLPRGGFYQSTGGNWAYVLTDDGTAVRQSIRLGRQNPNHFEVLEGLAPGDRVVVSSYDTFGDADRLSFE
jgi:HlyD family secretion protein